MASPPAMIGQRLGALAARAGDMVIEANFHSQAADELDKLRGLGARLVHDIFTHDGMRVDDLDIGKRRAGPRD